MRIEARKRKSSECINRQRNCKTPTDTFQLYLIELEKKQKRNAKNKLDFNKKS